MRRPRRALVLLAVVVWAGACSSGDSDESSPGTTGRNGAARSTTTASPPAADNPEAAALESRLSDRVPPGFTLTGFDVGDTGPSDLEKAIRDDGNDDAREVLVRTGFVAGFQHLWVNESDAALIEFLYEFRNEQGAIEYRDRIIAEISSTMATAPLQSFDSGVANATAFAGEQEGQGVALVLFAKGPYLAQVLASGPAGDDLIGRVKPLAQDQYGRL